MGTLLFALNRVRFWGIDHPVIMLCLVGSPLLGALFWRIERQARAPLMPPAMARRRGFILPIVAQALISGAYMGGFVVTPLLLEGVLGYSTTVIAFIMLPRPFAFAAASATAGHIERRLGIRALVTGGAVILTMALTGIAVSAGAAAVGGIVVGITMSGIGQGLTRPALVGSVGASVDEGDIGVASGLLQMSSQIGVAAGMTILTAMVGDSDEPETFRTVFLVAAAAACAGAVVGWFLRGEKTTLSTEPV